MQWNSGFGLDLLLITSYSALFSTVPLVPAWFCCFLIFCHSTLHMQPSVDWWAQRRLPVRLYLLSPSPLLAGQPALPPAERLHRERLLAAHWDLWPSYDSLIEELASLAPHWERLMALEEYQEPKKILEAVVQHFSLPDPLSARQKKPATRLEVVSL